MNSVQCLWCKEGVEDTIHALWYCPALNPIWYGDEMLTKLHRYKFDKFEDLIGMVFMVKERFDTNLLFVMLWLIWSNRNSIRMEVFVWRLTVSEIKHILSCRISC